MSQSDDKDFVYSLKETTKKVFAVVLLRGGDVAGNRHYCYVGIRADRYDRFINDQKAGKEIDPEKYGVVIAGGEGEPTEEVKAFMTEHFGFNHDSKVISPTPDQPRCG